MKKVFFLMAMAAMLAGAALAGQDYPAPSMALDYPNGNPGVELRVEIPHSPRPAPATASPVSPDWRAWITLALAAIAASGALFIFWATWQDARRPYGYWQCPNGHESSASGQHRPRHCTECGRLMAHRHPHRCLNGHEVPRGQKFCSRCGAPVPGSDDSGLGTLI